MFDEKADADGDDFADAEEVVIEYVEVRPESPLPGTRTGFACRPAATIMDRAGGFRPGDMYWVLLFFILLTFFVGFVFPMAGVLFRFFPIELFMIASGALMFLYLRRKIRLKKDIFVDCGLAKRASPYDWGSSLLILFAAMPVAGVAKWANDRLVLSLAERFFRLAVPGDALGRIIAYRGDGILTFLALFVVAVIFAPVNEELWFRGIGLSGYQKTGSTVRAVFWTSVVFGLTHGLGGFMHATVLGVALAVIRLRTGSLYCAMVMHGINNAIALFFAYMVFGSSTP